MTPLLALQGKVHTLSFYDFFIFLLGSSLELDCFGYIFDLSKQLDEYRAKVHKLLQNKGHNEATLYVMELFIAFRDFVMMLDEGDVYSNRGKFYVKGVFKYED